MTQFQPARRFIPVSQPALRGNEKQYVLQCLEENWISSNGRFIDAFEKEFARFCGVQHAIPCCNGTAALHVLLAALGVGPGDEVLVPNLTFIATANAVTYCGARPVLVDCDPITWNIDPAHLAGLITEKTKGIIAVHLFGLPADMQELEKIAASHGLFLIEDAAEAHGASYRGRKAGSLARAGIFSFYGNKIITTGEGGMVTTDDPELAGKVRILRGQGMQPDRRYWFPTVGYNYRMTNIAAAIGLGQLEDIEWHLSERQRIAAEYRQHLSSSDLIQFQPEPEPEHGTHAHWSVAILVRGATEQQRDAIMVHLLAADVETRPLFYPLDSMPPYKSAAPPLPVSKAIAECGIMLPTFSGLESAEVDYISATLLAAIEANVYQA
jgi:perosamine synthetase